MKFKDMMNSISFSHALSVAVNLWDDGIRPLVVAEAGVVVVVVWWLRLFILWALCDLNPQFGHSNLR